MVNPHQTVKRPYFFMVGKGFCMIETAFIGSGSATKHVRVSERTKYLTYRRRQDLSLHW